MVYSKLLDNYGMSFLENEDNEEEMNLREIYLMIRDQQNMVKDVQRSQEDVQKHQEEMDLKELYLMIKDAREEGTMTSMKNHEDFKDLMKEDKDFGDTTQIANRGSAACEVGISIQTRHKPFSGIPYPSNSCHVDSGVDVTNEP
mgnify:CR=1 FL=1